MARYIKQVFFSIAVALLLCFSLRAGEWQEKFAAVAEKAMPAVVTVYASGFSRSGVGSGFLISSDGVIVTNFHVIQHADTLAVKLADGKQFPAKIIGVSQPTDLAVLRISSKEKLPFLKFADTSKLKIGHYAIAIGSPFALSQTMTTGIVSFKGRELGLNYQEDYIQTDAAINPGNSGGPLLNINGEVIGVNDCFIAPRSAGKSSGSVGLGFAIDGNLARLVVLTILKSRLPQPSLGITMPEYHKNSPPVISGVLPKSPAAQAHLAVGDCILKIDRHKVSTIRELKLLVTAVYNPGDEVVITFKRNKKILRTKLKFGKFQ